MSTRRAVQPDIGRPSVSVEDDVAFSVAVSVNSDEVLKGNLLLSPGLAGGRHQLMLQRGFASASLAYNQALDEAAHDRVIFVHQDVYLPDGWFDDLCRAIDVLDREGVNWGVLGVYGCRRGTRGGLGQVYTRGVGRDGTPLAQPEPVETLDEIVLVLRKSSGLRFDPRLPHFHLYGTDISLAARERGLGTYAFQGFCVHNTNQLLILPPEFYACYRYVRRKWARYLPIHTSCMRISYLNAEFHLRRLVEAKQRLVGMRSVPARRVADPRLLCRERDDWSPGAGAAE